MVNSYVMMKRYCEMKGVVVPWTHHYCNGVIGYTHLDPHEYWRRRKAPANGMATPAAARSTVPHERSRRDAPRWTALLSHRQGVSSSIA